MGDPCLGEVGHGRNRQEGCPRLTSNRRSLARTIDLGTNFSIWSICMAWTKAL